MKKKLKGFTLIELLAIIVILAIVLVITIPVITKVVKNANKSAVIESAYGYKDAINKFYATETLKNPNFKLEDGTYNVSDLKNMGVSVNGTEPTEGWVEINKNMVTNYCIKIGNYVVEYDPATDTTNATKDGIIKAIVTALPTQIGAPVLNFGGYNWHVIKSDDTSVTLLMDEGDYGSKLLPGLTDGKLEHCSWDENTQTSNCNPIMRITNPLTSQTKVSPSYSWANSKIKEYLNNETEGGFLYTLKSKIGNNILPTKICNDNVNINVTVDTQGSSSSAKYDLTTYPGYLESELSSNSCSNNLGTYNVRLLSKKELENLKNNKDISDKDIWLNVGEAYTMTAIDTGSDYSNVTTIYYPLTYYYGTPTRKLTVRPVITFAQKK